MSRILILGANSSIGKAVAHQLAKRGDHLILAARREEPLKRMANDLTLRYFVDVVTMTFDALDYDSHNTFVKEAIAVYGKLEGIILAYGYFGNQLEAQTDFTEAKKIIDTNFTATVSILNNIADYFDSRQSGFICVLSSIDGDRGRKRNYLYGAANGGLSVYLQGLRHRLVHSFVTVTTVKVGHVDTKRTFGQEHLYFPSQPEEIARQVVKAIDHDKATVYAPLFWKYVMMVIKSLPIKVFRYLNM